MEKFGTESAVSPHAWGVVVVAVALMAIGLVTVASASTTLERSFWTWPPWKAPFGRQAIFSFAGLVVLMIATRVSARFLAYRATWQGLAVGLLALSLAGLALTLMGGLAGSRRGSQRWLRFPVGSFDFSIQPSELAKIALIVFLAWWLGRSSAQPRKLLSGFLPAALVLGSLAALVGKWDFGTAALLALVGGLIMAVAGCRWIYLIPSALLGAGGLAASVIFVPYRWQRLVAHGDLWRDSQGAGYQPLQSLTGIASGGWMGAGLGSGIQKYGYLPEAHTDFAFAILCEETGLVGAGLVVGLFCAMLWLGLRITLAAQTASERLLAFGVTVTLGLQAAMNIAVVTAVTPTKGISLPLVSAGGSGTLTYCFALGLLAGVAQRIGSGKSVAADPYAVGWRGERVQA